MKKIFFLLVYGKCYVILNSEIKVEFGDHLKKTGLAHSVFLLVGAVIECDFANFAQGLDY